jgi:hypothetical protein
MYKQIKPFPIPAIDEQVGIAQALALINDMTNNGILKNESPRTLLYSTSRIDD